ncbi:DUF4232 domain-containing protein [Amycolatopsis sp. PS_44_ISF1]|uniref:DUF4232 domain-containing protein n=1 Tax=Amycolatopsis sp. PS_44_ISF1 TaxID=2974917 RepID=UPI0028DDAAA7|nr:DUF4232 domain-containing protein [Amycolatopsis sp. PS_44_ISF1]MDT8911255.1 DUF4232 domain-containing protein [Amycolatopsis sp. PS_44_ISF1]
MNTRTTVRRTVTALAVAGAAAGASALAAGTANAMPTDFNCASSQISTKLVYGGAGAGNRQAALQFTANPGETCTLPGSLPVNLVGAHDVLVNPQAPADAPSVQLTDGSSAYIPLHWTAIDASSQQQTPLAIDVTAPQTTTPRGDQSDPEISVPWSLGGVDTSQVSHSIDVGAVTPGLAPSV